MSFVEALHHATGAPDKRKMKRNRVLLAAKFVYGEEHRFTADCTLRNLTEVGAAVRFDSDLPLPSPIQLVESRSGRAHEARIVWRRNGFIGLELSNTRELKTGAEPLRRLWAVSQLR